jgi:hypothetical protein
MGNKGKGRIKKKRKYTRTTAYEDRYNNRSPATVPESLLGILATNEINPQEHGYRCSFHLKIFQAYRIQGFHLGVFQGYRIQGNMCALISYSRSKDTP